MSGGPYRLLEPEGGPFKGDEGFSEDARSQDDGDSTMGVEPCFPSQPAAQDPLQALYEAILGLSEGQRSGM